MKTSICYAHAKFWGDLSVFGHKIARKPAKIAYDKTFDCNFWKFYVDHLKNKNTTVEFAVKTLN